MGDPLVQKLCRDLGIPMLAKSFDSYECYMMVEEYLTNYRLSTAENYIWRLCRYLEPYNLKIYDRYILLLQQYKKQYDHGYK